MNQENQSLFKLRSHARVPNNVQNKLIDLVFFKEWQIKQAASFLSIKYATAKHIINRYRQTKILKKPTNSVCKKRCLFKPIERVSNPIKLVSTQGGKQMENQMIKN